MSVIVLFASCKKAEDYGFDREGNLRLDTAVYLHSATLIADSPTQITVRIDMGVLNGLAPQELHPVNLFADTLNGTDFSLDFSNVTDFHDLQATTYSAGLMFNTYGLTWYNQNLMGYYLRRYFEQVEGLSTSRVGISKFDKGISGSYQAEWYRDSSSSLFENSWKYNVDKFHDISTVPGGYSGGGTNSQISNLITTLDQAIDTILADPLVGDEKMIVFFTSEDFSGSAPTGVAPDTLIYKAITNGVTINFVGTKFTPTMVRLATESGGFLCEYYNHVPPLTLEQQKKPTNDLAVFSQNLNRIISHDMHFHRCDLVIDHTGAGFTSKSVYPFSFKYGDRLFQFSIQMP